MPNEAVRTQKMSAKKRGNLDLFQITHTFDHHGAKYKR
jgi:hypothetical protein